ncbi:MAG: DUF5011 domain-containing protein [Gallionella sp.]|nr:DUF5011 domain-containing protein [Gallionella sp.]
MKTNKLFTVILTAFVCLSPCADVVAQAAPPVTVTAWGMHRGGQVIYKYQVKNMGTLPIDDFFIGFYPPTDTADGAAELTEGPYYPGGTSLWLPSSVSQSPAGWGVYLSFPEESATFALRWVEAGYFRGMRPGAREADFPIAQSPPNVMPPGASWDQFSVTLPRPDYAYVQGHANLMYGYKEITVQMEKGDTTPPTLSFTLSPATLWPPNDKLAPVTATITVNDDYDPEPEIKLESITASETLADGDIQDAQPGTDDRSYSLVAKRAGTNLAGRIYTVTYSATDASGNKATASATVTVPHDQGK